MDLEFLRARQKNLPFTAPTRVEGGYPLDFFDGEQGLEKLVEVYQLSAEEALRLSDAEPIVYMHLRRDPFTAKKEDGLYEMHMVASHLPHDLATRGFFNAVRLYSTLGEARGSVLVALIDTPVSECDEETDEQEENNALVALLNIETSIAQRTYAAPCSYCDAHVLHLEDVFVQVKNPKGPRSLLAQLQPQEVVQILARLRTVEVG